MRVHSVLVAWALCACDDSAISSPAAPAQGASLESADAGTSIASDGCPIEEVSEFYWRTTQITYDYQPVSADELLRHASLVVRGRVVGIGPSVPVPQRYADDVEVALELEVSHVYRGSAQPNERLFVAIDRSGVVTDADLAARSRMIPAAEVTVFLQASASRPAARKGEQRVFSLISPQALVVASSCGVATAFVEASPFAQPLANATDLHEAMATLSDPCRSQCPLTTTEPCAEKPFESFATLQVTEQEWLASRCDDRGIGRKRSVPFRAGSAM